MLRLIIKCATTACYVQTTEGAARGGDREGQETPWCHLQASSQHAGYEAGHLRWPFPVHGYTRGKHPVTQIKSWSINY